MLTQLVLVTAVCALVLSALVIARGLRREERARELLEESQATGTNVPASLHPVIDPRTCLHSAACVDACPEQVLGIVDGMTRMVQASSCIGHGRCHAACPVGAIRLVFGTAERGVDIPLLRAGYETDTAGLFIVGELGGMGLLKNSMRQGMQVVPALRRALERPGLPPPEPGAVDVAIVGGGPAGIACAAQCAHDGVRFVVLEQDSLGGSVTHYPRRKLIFSEPLQLPVIGRFGKREMLKEELIAELERLCLAAGVDILEGRQVVGIDGAVGRFRVRTQGANGAESFAARAVVLAIGRRGTPRRLGIPGEDQAHVVYRLLDPEQYRHRRVLVVGGGDSAVEAAVSLSQVAGCQVHLSYRGEAFFRIKRQNRVDLEARAAAGAIALHLRSRPVEILARAVRLEQEDGPPFQLEVDDVLVHAGGILPTPFLASLGVRVETRYGEAPGPAAEARA